MKMHFFSPCLREYIQAKLYPCKVALVLKLQNSWSDCVRLNKHNIIVKPQCGKEKQIQIKVGKTKKNEIGKIFFQ